MIPELPKLTNGVPVGVLNGSFKLGNRKKILVAFVKEGVQYAGRVMPVGRGSTSVFLCDIKSLN